MHPSVTLIVFFDKDIYFKPYKIKLQQVMTDKSHSSKKLKSRSLRWGDINVAGKIEHLMRISVYDRLLLEFQFARVILVSLYPHCTIMVTI